MEWFDTEFSALQADHYSQLNLALNLTLTGL